ncbi:hypothetical protein ACOMHN_025741 [Nucella lapillus]
MNTHDSVRELLSEQKLAAEESISVLSASVHKSSNCRKTSVSFDDEKQHGDKDKDQNSPSLKRSESFLLALSEEDKSASGKPNLETLQAVKQPALSGRWSPGERKDTKHQNQDSGNLAQQGHQGGSSTSFVSGSSEGPQCRICHEGEELEELVSPCYCSGSVGLLHLSCLEQWLGASHSTRCELCKYEFTLKRLPRPVTEFMQDPPSPCHRRNLICDLTCFILLTPVTATSAYLCSSGAMHYYHQQPDSWQVQGLIALTTCLIVVYFAWLAIGIHHHYNICKKWQQEHQMVKITYISPVKSKRTLRSSSLASCKLDTPLSPASSARGSITARGSMSDRASQHRPSLVATPVLRPILKYSTRFRASSWQSGLSDCALELGLPPSYVLGRSSSALLRSSQPRQETYV